MGDFNKVLSFILGLIVVVVFIAVVASRSNLRNHLAFLSNSQTTPTPKVKVTPTTTPRKESQSVNNYQTQTAMPTVPPKKAPKYVAPTQAVVVNKTQPATQYYNGKPLSSIPQTGPSIFMLPSMISMLGAGMFLRRKGK